MIRRLMQQAGINSMQLADKLQIDPRRVREWELGSKRPPVWVLDKVRFTLQKDGLLKR